MASKAILKAQAAIEAAQGQEPVLERYRDTYREQVVLQGWVAEKERDIARIQEGLDFSRNVMTEGAKSTATLRISDFQVTRTVISKTSYNVPQALEDVGEPLEEALEPFLLPSYDMARALADPAIGQALKDMLEPFRVPSYDVRAAVEQSPVAAALLKRYASEDLTVRFTATLDPK